MAQSWLRHRSVESLSGAVVLAAVSYFGLAENALVAKRIKMKVNINGYKTAVAQ